MAGVSSNSGILAVVGECEPKDNIGGAIIEINAFEGTQQKGTTNGDVSGFIVIRDRYYGDVNIATTDQPTTTVSPSIAPSENPSTNPSENPSSAPSKTPSSAPLTQPPSSLSPTVSPIVPSNDGKADEGLSIFNVTLIISTNITNITEIESYIKNTIKNTLTVSNDPNELEIDIITRSQEDGSLEVIVIIGLDSDNIDQADVEKDIQNGFDEDDGGIKVNVLPKRNVQDTKSTFDDEIIYLLSIIIGLLAAIICCLLITLYILRKKRSEKRLKEDNLEMMRVGSLSSNVVNTSPDTNPMTNDTAVSVASDVTIDENITINTGDDEEGGENEEMYNSGAQSQIITHKENENRTKRHRAMNSEEMYDNDVMDEKETIGSDNDVVTKGMTPKQANEMFND